MSNVEHPSHYNQYSQEVIDTIDEWVADYTSKEAYLIGNVLKYIARAPYKNNKLEDLEKASVYLNRVIKKVKYEENKKQDHSFVAASSAIKNIMEAAKKEVIYEEGGN